MEAAKDLLRRAVELDSAQRYPEALICYEEGIQNLLRAMEGRSEFKIYTIRQVTVGINALLGSLNANSNKSTKYKTLLLS